MQQNDNGGVPLDKTWFLESNATNCTSIRGPVRVFLRFETHLPNPFRDMLEIWSTGIKSKLSDLTQFHN
jgi:hypothetical protein